MSSKKNKKKKQQDQQVEDQIKEAMGQPWISMKSGVRIIAITSIFMAVLTAVQVYPSKGLWESIFWGLVFGALIWVIFYGFYYFRKFLK